MKKRTILTLGLVFMMSLACLTGCGGQNETQSASSAPAESASASTDIAAGGVLVLKVNPEIAVEYDDAGNVKGVTARNEDAKAIIEQAGDLIGQPAREAVKQLVTLIGDAGYFVEEVEGERRQITIEIEAGSKLPNDAFLDEVVADVKETVNSHQWQAPFDVVNESDYGITEYVDTDYGPDNDGYTDYGDDDDDTDYGPNNDGVTDYGDDQNDTDYGPNNDGVTDYGDGNTNYGDDDYGDSAYDG